MKNTFLIILFSILIFTVNACTVNCLKGASIELSFEKYLDIDLFDKEAESKQYTINNSLIIYINNISVAYNKKIVVSEFILSIANGDTLYDIGLVKYKNEKIGHFGRCDNSTRFFFSDTTFQEPVGFEYCMSLYTSNDYGKGIVFDRGGKKNGKTYITLFAQKNIYKIFFIDLEFDSDWILNNLSLRGSEISDSWKISFF